MDAKMKKIISDKRGDVPIMVLILGVFLICAIALGSFYLFQNSNLNKLVANTEAIEEAKIAIDKYYFYKALGKQDEEIDAILGIKKDESGKRYMYVDYVTSSVTYYFP